MPSELEGRVRTTPLKIGDVFAIECPQGIRCFQYLGKDETQMSSDVIAAFTPVFSTTDLPELKFLVRSEVGFYAHCIIKFGLKLSAWRKLGNTPVHADASTVQFRASSDYGNKAVSRSLAWWIWRMNEPQRFVGRLEGQNQRAFIGIVFTPLDISRWACSGKIEIGGYPSY